jgi:hypothetical protein
VTLNGNFQPMIKPEVSLPYVFMRPPMLSALVKVCFARTWKLENHLLSPIHDYLIDVSAARLYVWKPFFSISNLRMQHNVPKNPLNITFSWILQTFKIFLQLHMKQTR